MQPLPHWVLLTFSLLLAALPAPPAAARCLAPATERPTIGLVLAGGGARGSAHIGVIRVLEEMNVPIDCVGGTSMGSLVAGLYATGMSADELEAVILDIDWDDLFVDDTARADQPFRRKRDDNLALFGPKLGIGRDASLVKSGVIAGQKISFLFESLVKERTQAEDFDELPIPYRAVAADIATARKVVLSHGDLAMAMRSSMSVPGVFEPVPHQGHLLVDGGIVDNVPVDVLRDMGADILIVVDVGGGLTAREDLNSSFAVIGQLINMLVDGNSQAQLASLTGRDVLITPRSAPRSVPPTSASPPGASRSVSRRRTGSAPSLPPCHCRRRTTPPTAQTLPAGCIPRRSFNSCTSTTSRASTIR